MKKKMKTINRTKKRQIAYSAFCVTFLFSSLFCSDFFFFCCSCRVGASIFPCRCCFFVLLVVSSAANVFRLFIALFCRSDLRNRHNRCEVDSPGQTTTFGKAKKNTRNPSFFGLFREYCARISFFFCFFFYILHNHQSSPCLLLW